MQIHDSHWLFLQETLLPTLIHAWRRGQIKARVQQKLGREMSHPDWFWRLFGTENFVLVLINCCHIFNRFIVIRVCGAAHIAWRTMNPVARFACAMANASRYSGCALTLIYCRQHNSDDEIISDARCDRIKLCTDSDCESFRWPSSIGAYLRGALFQLLIVWVVTTRRVAQNVNSVFL